MIKNLIFQPCEAIKANFALKNVRKLNFAYLITLFTLSLERFDKKI